MKSPAVIAGGTSTTLYFQNTAANLAAFAQYHVKDQQDFYSKHGRYSDFASVSNEPNFNPVTYPGMQMNPSDMLAAGVAIRAAFDAVNIPTVLVAGDVSWDSTIPRSGGPFSYTTLPFVQGSKAFGGAGYHMYGGPASQMLEMAAYARAGSA